MLALRLTLAILLLVACSSAEGPDVSAPSGSLPPDEYEQACIEKQLGIAEYYQERWADLSVDLPTPIADADLLAGFENNHEWQQLYLEQAQAFARLWVNCSENAPESLKDLFEVSESQRRVLELDEWPTLTDIPLANSTIEVIQGTRTEDGNCIFGTYMEKGPDDPPLMSRTLSTDYETCEAVVEVGELSEEAYERLQEEHDEGESEAPIPRE